MDDDFNFLILTIQNEMGFFFLHRTIGNVGQFSVEGIELISLIG